MPQSKIDQTYSQGIRIFLENCVKELIDEHKGFRTPAEALREGLRRTANSKVRKLPVAEKAIQFLVHDFYHRTWGWLIIRLKKAQTYEAMREGADLVIGQICEGIETVVLSKV
ncbi:MAG: hypothetical protein V4478_02865 [Patescibacteria group bacterium]